MPRRGLRVPGERPLVLHVLEDLGNAGPLRCIVPFSGNDKLWSHTAPCVSQILQNVEKGSRFSMFRKIWDRQGALRGIVRLTRKDQIAPTEPLRVPDLPKQDYGSSFSTFWMIWDTQGFCEALIVLQ